jgi:hypothetical protein
MPSNQASFTLDADIPPGNVGSDHISPGDRQKKRGGMALIVIDRDPRRCGSPEVPLSSGFEGGVGGFIVHAPDSQSDSVPSLEKNADGIDLDIELINLVRGQGLPFGMGMIWLPGLGFRRIDCPL